MEFIFGGNTGLTLEDIQRRRAIAQAMVPRKVATNLGEGIGSFGRHIAAGLIGRQANKAERKGREGASQQYSDIVAALSQPRRAPQTAPEPAQGAVAESPLPPPGADDMSGRIRQTAEALGIDPVDLATVISYETAGTFDPTKAGPTTQWGQHKGLIQFGEPQAKTYGVDWNDPMGSQLGPDGAIAKYMRDAGVEPGMGLLDVYSAVNAGRVGRYDASDANNGGAPGTVRDKVQNQMAGHREKALALLGADPSQQQVAQASQAMPQPMPQSMPQQAGGLDPRLAELAGNSFLSDGQRAVVNALLQNQLAQMAPPEQMSPYQRETLNLQRQRLEAETNRGGFRPASSEEAQRYGAAAGQIGPDGRFYPINPPSGMAIESDGQGGFRLVQGAGVQNKPFTEGQSKDNVFSTRARGALPTLNEHANALTSVTDRAMDYDPTGAVRGNFQSPEYQVARAAGDEFLQAILRKDTGAAITEQEQVLYGRTYLPRPGDGPDVLAYKQQARERAINAIEAGMSPAQIVAQERALAKEQGINLLDGKAKDQEGAPEGVDPGIWDVMTPEERALWQN